MANPRYNTQVTQPRGGSARVGKMGGGMMMQRPMMKKGGRVKKMAGGRIAGAARRAQEHGYYTPDMGMKGGRMYRDGGKVGKKKPRVKVIGIGKAKETTLTQPKCRGLLDHFRQVAGFSPNYNRAIHCH